MGLGDLLDQRQPQTCPAASLGIRELRPVVGIENAAQLAGVDPNPAVPDLDDDVFRVLADADIDPPIVLSRVLDGIVDQVEQGGLPLFSDAGSTPAASTIRYSGRLRRRRTSPGSSRRFARLSRR
jgi:hypothetical protein